MTDRASFTTYLVGPLVQAFHDRYPNVILSVLEMSQERMEERLIRDEFDVGIAFDEVNSADIELQTLLVETLALVVGQRHPLAQSQTIGAQDLDDQLLVLLSAEFATRKQIERYCRQHEVRPKVLMEANSLSAVIEIIRHTQLATLLPSNIANDRDELIAVALAPCLLQRTAVLMQRKGAYQTAAVQAFVMLAHEYCKR